MLLIELNLNVVWITKDTFIGLIPLRESEKLYISKALITYYLHKYYLYRYSLLIFLIIDS
jgi:hypothetical protein